MWNEIYTFGIVTANPAKLKSLLFTDDQAILRNSEDYLQRGTYLIKTWGKNMGCKIQVGGKK